MGTHLEQLTCGMQDECRRISENGFSSSRETDTQEPEHPVSLSVCWSVSLSTRQRSDLFVYRASPAVAGNGSRFPLPLPSLLGGRGPGDIPCSVYEVCTGVRQGCSYLPRASFRNFEQTLKFVEGTGRGPAAHSPLERAGAGGKKP